MDRRPLLMLTGKEIVKRGRNVTNCILPEVGTKEVTPNGSWLETKQIQTALEARQALIATERIDKVGALSHAEWRGFLKLAEVTQQVGGYWQYMGHNVNGIFFLLPEEALYLIETNSLLLKHNNVTVSLQKAYNLLLDHKMTLTKYKVYASLSRVGYKVFRHEKFKMAVPDFPTNTMDSNISVKDKIIIKMDTNDDGNLDIALQLPTDDSFSNIESTELIEPPANGNILTNPAMPLDPAPTLDQESPNKETTMSSNSPSLQDETVKFIVKDTMMSSKISIPPNETVKLIDKNTTMSSNSPNPPDETVKSIDKDSIMSSNTLSLAGESVKSINKDITMSSISSTPLDETVKSIDKDTIISSNSPSPPDEIVKLIDKDRTVASNTPIPLIFDTIKKSVNKGTAMSPSLSSPEDPALPPNGNVTNKEIPRSSSSADDNTSNNEPKLSSDPPSLPPVGNISLDSTRGPDDKTPSIDSEMSSDPALPKGSPLPHDNTSIMEFKMVTDPTFPPDENTLNENSESKETTVIASCKDSNKECKISSDLPPLPKNTPNGNQNVPNNEKFTIQGTGLVPADYHVIFSVDELGVVRLEYKKDTVKVEMEPVLSTTSDFQASTSDADTRRNADSQMLNSYTVKKLKLMNRKIKPSDPKSMHDRFKDIPDFHKKQTVTVKVPSEDYLPRNVYLNKSLYVMNINSNSTRLNSTPSSSGNSAMYRTMKNSKESERAAVPTPEIPQLIPITASYQQPYNFFPNWRPRFLPHFRAFYPQHRFNHQFFYRMMHHTVPQNFNAYRPQVPYRSLFNLNRWQRKRHRRNVRDEHLRAVREVAQRLKQSTAPNFNLKRSLLELLTRFNEIYNERMRITSEFEIVKDTQTVETIELEDEDIEVEEVKIKKPRLEGAKFDQYLEKVKEIAARLKNLVRSQPVPKQKRAFCNLLKNFNATFDTELGLDDKGELIDKKIVIVDSSDDDVVATDDNVKKKSKKRSSDCDDNIETSKRKKTKVLRNPFSFLNKTNEGASTSHAAIGIPVETSTSLPKHFDKNWLRNEDDFGKPTICSKMDARHLLIDSRQLFDFMDSSDAFNNWVELKTAFCMHMEAVTAFNDDLKAHSSLTMENSRLKPILQGETAGDWAASLEKLRIIKTNTDVQETSLRIDFDVYNRDVQNFRKTDPPKPHFRIVCVDESSNFPSGAEVRALHSKLDDNVTIVFAIVGLGSITYLQINPTDLPIYVGND